MSIYTKETAIEEILRIKSEKVKATSYIKNNKNLWNWINLEILRRFPFFNESDRAKIWLILNPNYEIICPYGKIRMFRKDVNRYVCTKQCKCTKDNRDKTSKEKYGDNFYEIFYELAKQGMICKYGYDNALKVPEIIDQRKIQYFEKTGYKNPSQNPEVKQKRKNTCIEKFEANSVFESNGFLEKRKNKCKQLYDVDYATQSPIIKEKVRKTTFENWGSKVLCSKTFISRNNIYYRR